MTRFRLVAAVTAALSLTAPAAAQIVADGGFEAGTPNPFWDEFSQNFASPICNTQRCGSFFGGPFEGLWWAWFGGSTRPEVGWLSQEVTIPVGTATLTFWLDITAASGNGGDFLTASLDGEVVFRALESEMNAYHPWTQVSVDISAFADGRPHVLRFDSTVSGPQRTNFFVDAVEIVSSPSCTPCDVNCDGAVNASDVQAFVGLLVAPIPAPCSPCAGDANGDGVTDPSDLGPFVQCLLGS